MEHYLYVIIDHSLRWIKQWTLNSNIVVRGWRGSIHIYVSPMWIPHLTNKYLVQYEDGEVPPEELEGVLSCTLAAGCRC